MTSCTVAPGGIVHLECGTAAASAARLPILRYWDAATGEDHVVATLDVPMVNGVSPAPGGKSIAYAGGRINADVMMIENFR